MSLHQQLEAVAQSIPMWLIIFGHVGGLAIALGNIYSLAQEERSGIDLLWPLLAIAFGLGLAAYFTYLAVLKVKRGR